MSPKSLVWIGVSVGSALGSYVPMLWGASLFSLSSVVLGGVGAFVGIWAGYQLSQRM